MIKVVHLSSTHPHTDNRIFRKECCSLVAAGYKVTLIAPGAPLGAHSGVQIRGVKRFRSRLFRFTLTSIELLAKALRENAVIYHLHEFNLIPLGLVLKLLGKRVVYDVHEDTSTQKKEWLPGYLGEMVARVAPMVERIADRTFDGIVVATETIGQRFSPGKSALVRNFVLRTKADDPSGARTYGQRERKVIYAGALSEDRGMAEMIAAVAAVGGGAQLVLVGHYNPPGLESRFSQLPGFARVDYRGLLPPAGVPEVLREARVGIVILHPILSYIDSLPTKLFEYMHAGLPVVASDFPNFRTIVEEAGCGLLVDPLNSSQVAAAIEWLLDHPVEAEAMGHRGQQAVAEKYTWDAEASKLIALYRRIVGPKLEQVQQNQTQ